MKNLKYTSLVRHIILMFFIFISYNANSQEYIIKDKTAFESKIKIINNKISNSTKEKKLFWLDSLCKLIEFKKEYNYESKVRQTINLAIKDKNLIKAAFHTENLQNYYNNITGEPEKAITVFDSMYPKLKSASNKDKSSLFLNLGDSNYFLGNVDKAENYYKQAYTYAEKCDCEKLKAYSLLYQSEILAESGNFAKASKYLITASEIFNAVKDTFNIISTKSSLLFLYGKNGFFKEADKVRNEAIALAEATHSYGQLSSLYYNRANDEKQSDNYKLKLFYLKKALFNARKSKYQAMQEPSILSSIVANYALNNQVEIAQKCLDTLLTKYPDDGNLDRKKFLLTGLRNLAFAKKEYPKALKLSKEQLEIEHKYKHIECIKDVELFLSQVYEKTGDFKQSNSHYKLYSHIKDSISDVQKINALTYYQTLYESEKKDNKIGVQQSKIALLNSSNKLKNQWIIISAILLVSLFGFLWHIRSRHFAKRNQKQLEQFSQDLIKVQEEERIRVARDLHDSVGQKLMLLTKKTKETSNEDVNKLADSTLEELRNISRGIYPATLEKLGITSALKTLIDEVDSNSTILFDYEIDDIDACLNKDTALQFYRIVQEVLNNIIKHSQTNEASISVIKSEKAIDLTIIDKGIGFNAIHSFEKLSSMGMKTIHERVKIINGTITINSKPKKGTQVYLTLPI
ncbi:MAG TPA: sensor histidine kinase [Flavobacterium lutivivi]|nr:sensor histidine kinase [Flavobacterium lutivivi]